MEMHVESILSVYTDTSLLIKGRVTAELLAALSQEKLRISDLQMVVGHLEKLVI